MELNLASLDASGGVSPFPWTVTNSIFSITPSGQSSAFILLLVRGWMTS